VKKGNRSVEKMLNEELHNLYSLLNIIRVKKVRADHGDSAV
jgi:hypothetical protein